MSKLPELLFPNSLGFGKHQSLDQDFWRLPYPTVKVARKQSNERREENAKVNFPTKRLFVLCNSLQGTLQEIVFCSMFINDFGRL